MVKTGECEWITYRQSDENYTYKEIRGYMATQLIMKKRKEKGDERVPPVQVMVRGAQTTTFVLKKGLKRRG
jgi:hypothetical protein